MGDGLDILIDVGQSLFVDADCGDAALCAAMPAEQSAAAPEARYSIAAPGHVTVVIEDAGGNLKVVNNSDIRNFQNRSRNNSVALCTVSVSYGTDLRKLEALLTEKLPDLLAQHPDLYLSAPRYLGVDALADSGVDLKFAVSTMETNVFSAQRMLARDIKLLFDDNGVEIPFPQVVLHQGKD